MLTGAEVAVKPALFVALAVNTYVPGAETIHDLVNGVVLSLPIDVEPA
jgi:hypothetical protein